MTWNIALDLLMTVLLAVSIGVMVVLNRRLNTLRAARAELEVLAESFRESTSRADAGVAGLKLKTQSLQERIETARALADDLQFLIERGGGIADRLEADVRAARRTEPRVKATPTPATASGVHTAAAIGTAAATPAPARGRDSADQPRSAAERHLLAALRARA